LNSLIKTIFGLKIDIFNQNKTAFTLLQNLQNVADRQVAGNGYKNIYSYTH